MQSRIDILKPFLRKYYDKIVLCTGMFINRNPNSIHFINTLIDRNNINICNLSHNPAAIPYLVQNPEKINWKNLCSNTHPLAINMIEHILDNPQLRRKITLDWKLLCRNPSAGRLFYKHIDKLDWSSLSENSCTEAVELLLNNPENIDWWYLSYNESTEIIKLLEQNISKINRSGISKNSNPRAIQLLRTYPHLIVWERLCHNTSMEAIDILKENFDNILWYSFSSNPSGIELIEGNLDKVHVDQLCENTAAMHLLEPYLDSLKIIPDDLLEILSRNPEIFVSDEFVEIDSYIPSTVLNYFDRQVLPVRYVVKPCEYQVNRWFGGIF